mgnify:FL=1
MSDEKRPFADLRIIDGYRHLSVAGIDLPAGGYTEFGIQTNAETINAAVERERREAAVKALRDLARQDQLAGPWLNARAAKIERGEQ